MHELIQDNQVENMLPDDSENSVAADDASQCSPKNPPWNSLGAFAFWMISVFLIVVLPSLFIIPYLLNKGVQLSNNPHLMTTILNDPAAVSISLGSTLLAHIQTLAIAWAIVTNFNKYSFTEMLGWKLGGFRIWHGALILVGIYALAIALTSLLGSHENEMSQILRSSRLAVYLVAVIATLSAPIVEEVVYRGVLYSALQRSLNVPVAVGMVTFIFAAVHFRQYYPDYATIISICVLSFVITLIRVKTDNLLPCIIFHMVFNGIQSLLLIIEPHISIPNALEILPDEAPSLIYLAEAFRSMHHFFN